MNIFPSNLYEVTLIDKLDTDYTVTYTQAYSCNKVAQAFAEIKAIEFILDYEDMALIIDEYGIGWYHNIHEFVEIHVTRID